MNHECNYECNHVFIFLVFFYNIFSRNHPLSVAPTTKINEVIVSRFSKVTAVIIYQFETKIKQSKVRLANTKKEFKFEN